MLGPQGLKWSLLFLYLWSSCHAFVSIVWDNLPRILALAQHKVPLSCVDLSPAKVVMKCLKITSAFAITVRETSVILGSTESPLLPPGSQPKSISLASLRDPSEFLAHWSQPLALASVIEESRS